MAFAVDATEGANHALRWASCTGCIMGLAQDFWIFAFGFGIVTLEPLIRDSRFNFHPSSKKAFNPTSTLGMASFLASLSKEGMHKDSGDVSNAPLCKKISKCLCKNKCTCNSLQ